MERGFLFWWARIISSFLNYKNASAIFKRHFLCIYFMRQCFLRCDFWYQSVPGNSVGDKDLYRAILVLTSLLPSPPLPLEFHFDTKALFCTCPYALMTIDYFPGVQKIASNIGRNRCHLWLFVRSKTTPLHDSFGMHSEVAHWELSTRRLWGFGASCATLYWSFTLWNRREAGRLLINPAKNPQKLQ